MKKKILSVIIFIFIAAFSGVYASGVPADFTGENYFRAPMEDISKPASTVKDTEEYTGTIPLFKLVRLKVKERIATREMRAEAKAKRKAIKEAMKQHEKNKSANLEDKDIPTGEDIEHLELGGVEDIDAPQRIVITCDNMDYVTEESVLNARGNVLVTFVEEGATLKTDHLIYDKRSNNIKALGNVVISKKGVDVLGEFINIDLNKENALLEKPLSKFSCVSVSADKGYVYQNKVVQENGRVTVDSSFPIELEPHGKAPKLKKMMIGLDKTSIDDFVGDSCYRVKVSNIIINSDKRIESLELRKAQIYKGDKKLFTVPWLKFYTNKNHDFVDGDFPEIASRRHMGFFVGPGWAFKMPFGSLLKVAPVAAYKSGDFGVGGFARFMSGTNTTELGYATAKDKFVLRGEQVLDDHLRLIYGANDYMDNWFLGRRAPKYGVDLVYHRAYPFKDFLYKDLDMKFSHQASLGLFGDAKSDKYYRGLKGNETDTTRYRYMMQIEQKLWNYKNEEDLLAADISIVGQASAALYGTGDTQFVGRIGPRLHTQYKRWMQDLGYFQSGYHDQTPIPVFDAYRYGHSNLYLREYFRVHRFLTLSWLASVTLTDDSPNNKLFQECSFFVSVGPDDMKLNVGYDFIRENAYVNVSVGLDSKGTVIDYDRLEIKNPDMFKPMDKTVFYVGNSDAGKDSRPTILQRAVVEDVIENHKVKNDL